MISTRIQKLRNFLSLTQTDFAKRIGMDTKAVHNWEHNKKTIKESSLILIELIYNVNPQWLREGEGDMFMPVLQEDLVQIVEWLKTLPPKKQIWAAEEIKRHIPELEKWINE